MDYCAPGSIRDLMELINMPLSEEQAAYVCRAALKGLVVLHGASMLILLLHYLYLFNFYVIFCYFIFVVVIYI